MSIKKSYFLILISILIIQSCSNEKYENKRFEIKKSKNSIELNEVVEIYIKEDQDNVLGIIGSMQVDNSNNFYFADNTRKQIMVFDSQGNFIRPIGKYGEGPGELRSCHQICLHENVIGVLDQASKKIDFFYISGNYINSLKLISDQHRPMGGNFDFSPDGRLIYVGCIENKIMPLAEFVKKTNTVFVFDEKCKFICSFGQNDPLSWDFGGRMDLNTKVRSDVKGNIYTVQVDIPRITRYDQQYRKSDSFSFYTPNFKMPYLISNNINYNSPETSKVLDFFISKNTGYFFIQHWHFTGSSFNSKDLKFHLFLTIIDSNGQILAADIPMPNSSFCIDNEDYIYFFKKNEPDSMIIGKYELVPVGN